MQGPGRLQAKLSGHGIPHAVWRRVPRVLWVFGGAAVAELGMLRGWRGCHTRGVLRVAAEPRRGLHERQNAELAALEGVKLSARAPPSRARGSAPPRHCVPRARGLPGSRDAVAATGS